MGEGDMSRAEEDWLVGGEQGKQTLIDAGAQCYPQVFMLSGPREGECTKSVPRVGKGM